MSVVPLTRPDEAAASAAPLTLIERALPAGFAPWLSGLPGACWPDGRFVSHTRNVRAGMRELFDQCDTPPGEIAEWWAADVAELAAQFAEIAGEDIVDVRLERVTGNACTKFHRDNVPVRLVTTYFGPGTEMVPGDFGVHALAQQRDYAGPVERLEAGAIAIFRGRAGGVVHRSPQIAETGETRAMLCLNIRFSASPELWSPAQT